MNRKKSNEKLRSGREKDVFNNLLRSTLLLISFLLCLYCKLLFVVTWAHHPSLLNMGFLSAFILWAPMWAPL